MESCERCEAKAADKPVRRNAMNEIFQLLNPSNTLTVNRMLAHSIGLSEAVVYAALISKCSYYERNGKLDDEGWFYSTVPDLEASTALSE